MNLIWIFFFIEIIILSLIKPFINDFNSISVVAVLINVAMTSFLIIIQKSKFKHIFLMAFLLRVIFLYWDIYARDIFTLPGSGADSEMFYNQSIMVSQNLQLLFEHIRGELYGKINGILFYLIGPQRLVGQYMNVLLGFSTITVIYNTLCLLNVKIQHLRKVILIAAFFPNSVIMSAVFLREMLPTFFVACSMYYFIKWFVENKKIQILLSLVTLAVASTFHSGVIGIIFGYFFVVLFYQRSLGRIKFTYKTIIMFFILIGISWISFKNFGSVVFSKFGDLNSIDKIYSATNYREGGSAYLNDLVINNPIQLAIYGPLKAFYFISSPLPTYWRGILDVVTFFTDSILYLGITLYFIKNRRMLNNSNVLIVALFIMIISAAIVFGIGVNNAGTAFRHRQKLIPVFLVFWSLIMNENRRENS